MDVILYVLVAVLAINANYVIAWCHWELARGRWEGRSGIGDTILRRILWPLTGCHTTYPEDRPAVMEWKRNSYLIFMSLGGVELKVVFNSILLVLMCIYIPVMLLITYLLQVTTWPMRYLGLNNFRPGDLAWHKFRTSMTR